MSSFLAFSSTSFLTESLYLSQKALADHFTVISFTSCLAMVNSSGFTPHLLSGCWQIQFLERVDFTAPSQQDGFDSLCNVRNIAEFILESNTAHEVLYRGETIPRETCAT